MENKLLLFMEDFGYAPDSYIETVISDYEHKGIVFYVKHFNDLMTWLSESPNAVEFVNNLMRTQYFSSLQNLLSRAYQVFCEQVIADWRSFSEENSHAT